METQSSPVMQRLFQKMPTSRRSTVGYGMAVFGVPSGILLLYMAHGDHVLTLFSGVLFSLMGIAGGALWGLIVWYIFVQPVTSGMRLAGVRPGCSKTQEVGTESSAVHGAEGEKVVVALSGTVNTLWDRLRIASVVTFGGWWRAARTLGISLSFAVPVLILLLLYERRLTTVALLGVAMAAVAPVVLLLAWVTHAMRKRQRSGAGYRWMVLSATGIGFGEDEDQASHDTKVRWTDLDRVSEGRKDFYFWRSGRLLFALPKHHLASEDDVGAVRGLLRRSRIRAS